MSAIDKTAGLYILGRNRRRAADYSASPYPHIFFRNFFPADFYRDLTAAAKISHLPRELPLL